MAYIISIDSSTSICSVALHQDGKLVAHTETFLERSHSRNISHMTEHILALCEFSANALDAIAVSAGPGSYTGMRIGVSTAKGYCFALDKPLLSVSSLYSMAAQMQHKRPGVQYCPMIDARRMEVYTAVYDEDLKEIQKEQAIILEDGTFAERLRDQQVLFGGDGSSKFQAIINHPNACFAREIYPSAAFMGGKAFEKFTIQQFEDLAYFEPNYLKEFYTK